MNELLARPWARRVAAVLGMAFVVYGMIYVDVVLRARSAFNEAERYLSWHSDSAGKRRHFEARYESKLATLKKNLKAGEIDRIEFDERAELAEFEREHNIEESSIKYAYLWYQTCVELFSPPESRWVKKARVKMIETKDLWKKELTAKGIPFEDYMLE